MGEFYSFRERLPFRSFTQFQEEGLLWALNRHVFHPKGYAIMFMWETEDDGKLKEPKWSIAGDGSETYSYDPETDDKGLELFNAFMKKVEESTYESSLGNRNREAGEETGG